MPSRGSSMSAPSSDRHTTAPSRHLLVAQYGAGGGTRRYAQLLMNLLLNGATSLHVVRPDMNADEEMDDFLKGRGIRVLHVLGCAREGE